MQPSACVIPFRYCRDVHPPPEASRYSIVHLTKYASPSRAVASSSLAVLQALTITHSALAADVLLLNEIGLDPGIDHCSAISLLDNLHARNARILSFTSFCGGLPAPECADVPLSYKFSWSPRGVLSAALNSARFRMAEQVCFLMRIQ